MTQEPEVLIRRIGRAGRITLNRPKALNALGLAMVREIWAALLAWKDDPTIHHIVLDGTGGRALCAGGDVRWLYDGRVEGSKHARAFWTEEYRLNALIGSYPKPFIPLMDGIVMGGGIGLSAHSTGLRVVTERSRLAMPETSIGLIPDVGGTWLLAKAPAESGVYLGLLGEQFGAADAIYAGFADWHVPSGRLSELTVALEADPRPALEIVGGFATSPGDAPLSGEKKAIISACFRHDSVEAILTALKSTGGAIAEKALADLATRSPKSLRMTLAAIRNAHHLPSLARALEIEYRLCVRMFEDGEFIEGVRAAIVDKDRSPKWRPATLAEVTPEVVAHYLGPLPAGEDIVVG
ncbi:MAG TPA: enoyl-CoA hydratase/isomerase family protein [Hyphomicrobiaceae bacterium]|nr:enoyl-CoA hydratase/isomerase family protein [Hyphomicrobiaceae bacterium]